MRAPKIKKKMFGNTDEVGVLFNQMLGIGDVDVGVTYPKAETMLHLMNSIVTILGKIEKTVFMQSIFPAEAAEINRFCTSSAATLKDLVITAPHAEPMTAEDRKLYTEQYHAIKKSALGKVFMTLSDNLIDYKEHLVEGQDDYSFVFNIPGLSWRPFPPEITTLDLRRVFMTGVSDQTKRLVMLTLSKCLAFSYQLWDTATSADIDVDAFARVTLEGIDQLKLTPELSRCGRAFAAIHKSIDILKSNLNTYYRDSTATGNTKIICENFILDVSKENVNDIELVRQFMCIIKFYRKHAAGGANPQLDRIVATCDQVEVNFPRLQLDKKNEAEKKAKQTADQKAEQRLRMAQESALNVAPAESYETQRMEASQLSAQDLADAINGKNKKMTWAQKKRSNI